MFGDSLDEKKVECGGLGFIDNNILVVFNKLKNKLQFYPKVHLSTYSIIGEIEIPFKNNDIKLSFLLISKGFIFVCTKEKNYLLRIIITYGAKKRISIKHEFVDILSEKVDSGFKSWSQIVSPSSNLDTENVLMINNKVCESDETVKKEELSFLILTKDNKLYQTESKGNKVLLSENVIDFWIEEVTNKGIFFYVYCIPESNNNDNKPEKPMMKFFYLYHNNEQNEEKILDLLWKKKTNVVGIPTGHSNGKFMNVKNEQIFNGKGFEITLSKPYSLYIAKKLLYLYMKIKEGLEVESKPFERIKSFKMERMNFYSDSLEGLMYDFLKIRSKKKIINKELVAREFREFFFDSFGRSMFFICLSSVTRLRRLKERVIKDLKIDFELPTLFFEYKNDIENIEQAFRILILLGPVSLDIDDDNKEEEGLDSLKEQSYNLLILLMRNLDSNKNGKLFIDILQFVSKVNFIKESEEEKRVLFKGWLNDSHELQKVVLIFLKKRILEMGDFSLFSQFHNEFAPNFDSFKFCEIFLTGISSKDLEWNKEFNKIRDSFELPECYFIKKGLVNKTEQILVEEELPFYTITQYYIFTNKRLSENILRILDILVELKIDNYAMLFALLTLKVSVLKQICKRSKLAMNGLKQILTEMTKKYYSILFKKIEFFLEFEKVVKK